MAITAATTKRKASEIKQRASVRLPQSQPDLPVHHSMREPADFSPLVASAWADAIIAFWQSASVQGRLDPTQPLEVLDLMPGSGESVRILMRALEQRMAMLPGFAHSLRYLMVGHRRDSLTPTRWQSELQPSLQAEKLVTVLWDPGRGDPCLLRPGKRSAWKPINPVAVIAHDSWAKLGQRLCAVHYGRLLDFKNSTMLFIENICFKLLTGFSRSPLGMRTLNETSNPIWIVSAKMPTMITMRI